MSRRALVLGGLGSPYHRLARTSRVHWWRTLLALVFLAVTFALIAGAAIAAGLAVHDPGFERPGGSDFDQAWRLVTLVAALAALIPAAFLTVRWIERRPAGSLSSVAGHLRWSWLGSCLLVASVIGVLTIGLAVLVGAQQFEAANFDLGLVACVALVSALLVPFQAAAEEYLFRGYLAQAFGAYLTGPWIPALICSLLFGLAHGTVADQGVWLFIDRAGFGLVAAWLVIRTGGLEAAIGLHAGLNMVGFVLSAADGSFATYFSADEQPAAPGAVLIDLTVVVLTALLMLRLAGCRGLQTVSTPPPAGPKRPLRLW
jgi:uncharacterized protein